MMKLLVLLAVVLGVAWFVIGRGRRGGDGAADPAARKPDKKGKAEAVPMLACAHCGVHLPTGDAVPDAQGRMFCTEAHRLAGPR